MIFIPRPQENLRRQMITVHRCERYWGVHNSLKFQRMWHSGDIVRRDRRLPRLAGADCTPLLELVNPSRRGRRLIGGAGKAEFDALQLALQLTRR